MDKVYKLIDPECSKPSSELFRFRRILDIRTDGLRISKLEPFMNIFISILKDTQARLRPFLRSGTLRTSPYIPANAVVCS
jgi:hypothetical protein